MNENNVEYLQKELSALKFDAFLHNALKMNIQKQLPEFQLRQSVAAEKGQVDYTLHFRKSNQSDLYFFNKYEASLSNIPTPEKDQKFMVISSDPSAKKSSFTTFQNPVEAIRHFKQLEGNHELAVGKSPKEKTTLAIKEGEKINVVEKDFKQTFYKPALTHTFYIDKGKGFNAQQAANLLQGRSVFRDDFVSLEGQQFQAWTKLDFDQPKDQNGNFVLAQYHHPAYGFDLEKSLNRYYIKELQDPAAKENLLQTMQQGERPVVTAIKDGKDVKVAIEAAPRFKNLNLFNEQGKPEKREQFEKRAGESVSMEKGDKKTMEIEENKRMSI